MGWTNNGKKLLLLSLNYSNLQSLLTNMTLVDMENNNRQIYNYAGNYNSGGAAIFGSFVCTSNSSGYDIFRIAIGSGDTAVTENDYALDNQIAYTNIYQTGQQPYPMTSLMVAHWGPEAIDPEDGKPYIEYSITGKNTTSDPIEIKEIGLQRQLKHTNGNNNVNYAWFLLWREVLDTPIRVAVGGTYEIKLRFKI